MLCPTADASTGNGRGNGNGHAQRSIEHRLRYHFGPTAGMVTRHDAGYYTCELKLPI